MENYRDNFSLSRQIEDFCNDNRSGSRKLLEKCLNILTGLLEIRLHDRLFGQIREFSEVIVKCHPSMESLAKLSRMLDEIVKQDINGEEKILEIRKIVNGLREQFKGNVKSIAGKLRSTTSKMGTLITLSYSQTVLDTLKILHSVNDLKKVIVCESRPVKEGIDLAKELSSYGIETLLIVDAAMDRFMKEADAAVIGADSVFSDYSVLNKIGSRALALSSRNRNKPFYVLCESSKLNETSNRNFTDVERESTEILDADKDSLLRVKNVYFEVIEKELITAIITEKRVIK